MVIVSFFLVMVCSHSCPQRRQDERMAAHVSAGLPGTPQRAAFHAYCANALVRFPRRCSNEEFVIIIFLIWVSIIFLIKCCLGGSIHPENLLSQLLVSCPASVVNSLTFSVSLAR